MLQRVLALLLQHHVSRIGYVGGVYRHQQTALVVDEAIADGAVFAFDLADIPQLRLGAVEPVLGNVGAGRGFAALRLKHAAGTDIGDAVNPFVICIAPHVGDAESLGRRLIALVDLSVALIRHRTARNIEHAIGADAENVGTVLDALILRWVNGIAGIADFACTLRRVRGRSRLAVAISGRRRRALPVAISGHGWLVSRRLAGLRRGRAASIIGAFAFPGLHNIGSGRLRRDITCGSVNPCCFAGRRNGSAHIGGVFRRARQHFFGPRMLRRMRTACLVVICPCGGCPERRACRRKRNGAPYLPKPRTSNAHCMTHHTTSSSKSDE